LLIEREKLLIEKDKGEPWSWITFPALYLQY
jgi:hypothetical protein